MSDVIGMVVDTIDRLIDLDTARACTSSLSAGERPGLWASLDELGLSRLAIREADGGAEIGWPELCDALRAFARAGAPTPVPDEIVARALIAEAGLPQPNGMVVLADPQYCDVAFEQGRASGEARSVAYGRFADFVLLAAGPAEAGRIVLVDTAGATTRQAQNFAGEPRDTLSFSRATAEAMSWPAARRHLSGAGALLRSAQISGGLERLLELSVTYTAERRQFGKPLAAFQAVQQLLARLAEENVAATMAARSAFAARGGDGCEVWTAIAKVRAADAAVEASAIAHQLHGAIGFTLEHHLRYFTLRCLAWKQEYGSPEAWAKVISSIIGDASAAPWMRLVETGRAVGRTNQGERHVGT